MNSATLSKETGSMNSASMSRRLFLEQARSPAGPCSASARAWALAADDSGKPAAGKIGDFKISLAEWSLHKALFAKKIDNLDFPKIAREDYGIDGVEFVNQFFKDKAHDSDLPQGPEEARQRRRRDLRADHDRRRGRPERPDEDRSRSRPSRTTRSGSTPRRRSAATRSGSTPASTTAPPTSARSPRRAACSPTTARSTGSRSSARTTAARRAIPTR